MASKLTPEFYKSGLYVATAIATAFGLVARELLQRDTALITAGRCAVGWGFETGK